MNDIDGSLYYALLIGVAISVVSYFDDLYELSARLRLAVQSLTAIFGLYLLGGLAKIDFIIFSIDNQILTNIFSFFLIIWFINLYNFLDGIDGYAGSEAIFLGLGGFFFFGDSHFLVLIVAVFGFLVWNWHKAKIFMGDVGSTLLGYNVAIFTLYYTNHEAQNLWIWIILFGAFWYDATLTLYRRYLNGERLSLAHKKHAYQRLTQCDYSHSRVVILAMTLNLSLFSIAYFVSNMSIALILSIALLYGVVKYIDKKKKFETKYYERE